MGHAPEAAALAPELPSHLARVLDARAEGETDFSCLKVIGWGWFYLSTILNDYSRYIIAWKLCTTIKATDDETLFAIGSRTMVE